MFGKGPGGWDSCDGWDGLDTWDQQIDRQLEAQSGFFFSFLIFFVSIVSLPYQNMSISWIGQIISSLPKFKFIHRGKNDN